jgi:hypothetical protein
METSIITMQQIFVVCTMCLKSTDNIYILGRQKTNMINISTQ